MRGGLAWPTLRLQFSCVPDLVLIDCCIVGLLAMWLREGSSWPGLRVGGNVRLPQFAAPAIRTTASSGCRRRQSWPFAKLRNTPVDLARQVARALLALLAISADADGVRWTVPTRPCLADIAADAAGEQLRRSACR